MTLYSRGQTTNLRHRSRDFTLALFREDSIRIKNLVSKIPYAETGGNLFGLWTNQGNAVVLVATGPGKNCKRSSASFYQDIPYMQRVGNLLTRDYPLCHIGEWHSHHQMQLYEPSFGDCNTVQRNYPRGAQGFVLMIANILHNGKVKLSPYKFTDERSPYKIGEIEDMTVENPFMKVDQITYAIENGKEGNIQQSSRTETERQCQGARETQTDISHRAKREHCHSSQRGHNRSRSRSPIRKSSGLSPEEEEIDIQERRPITLETATHEISELSNRSNDRLQHNPSTRNIQSGREKFVALQWYETDTDAVEKTMRFVSTMADHDQIKMARDKTTQNLTITFTHHSYPWAIYFPAVFPKGSVKLRSKVSSYSVEVQGSIDKFKDNLESTLRDQCTQCKPIISASKEVPPSQQERTEGHQRLRGKTLKDQWYEINPANLERIIDFVTSLANGNTPELSRETSTNNVTMEFKHHNHKWAVEFPPNFPITGNVKLKKSANDCTKSYNYAKPYSYTKPIPLSYNVKAYGDVNSFMLKLKHELYKNCSKCEKERRYTQNNRYTRHR